MTLDYIHFHTLNLSNYIFYCNQLHAYFICHFLLFLIFTIFYTFYLFFNQNLYLESIIYLDFLFKLSKEIFRNAKKFK